MLKCEIKLICCIFIMHGDRFLHLMMCTVHLISTLTLMHAAPGFLFYDKTDLIFHFALSELFGN